MIFPNYQVWIDLAGKREAALILVLFMTVQALAAVVGVRLIAPKYLDAARVLFVAFFFATLAVNWMLK